jgi:hypothetical protein
MTKTSATHIGVSRGGSGPLLLLLQGIRKIT